ncbi:C1 family peptidase [Methanolacinia paynteri]|uniref:C1 family peptidase n=1 Tax=Methanolacinia paynteri TaxID=230356 RepID=UPI00064E8DC9|nr:C1 family peptidase [Methanolacinia paynteri]
MKYIGQIILVLCILSLILSYFVLTSPEEDSDSCSSCSDPYGMYIDGVSLNTMLSGDLDAFRSVDPLDIEKAVDISIYEMADSIRLADLNDDVVTTDQSSDKTDEVSTDFQTKIVLAMQEANRNTPRYPPREYPGNIPDSVSLLEKFAYVPEEWDQTGGSPEHCGNCWVWADTGALQVELYRQKGINDPLSVQYFTSAYHNGTGIWACCGGSPVWFADFYNITGKVVPLGNMNATFADSAVRSEKGESTSVPAADIQTDPYYPIEEMHAEMIATNTVYEERDISNETAIDSIKSVLLSGSAVVIIYTPDDWDPFMDFWENETESAIFTPESTQGATGNDGGHAMLILGYNDTDTDERYWTVLNSWGAPANRPDGTFRLDLDLDYSMQNPDGVNSFEFYVQNVTWGDFTSL